MRLMEDPILVLVSRLRRSKLIQRDSLQMLIPIFSRWVLLEASLHRCEVAGSAYLWFFIMVHGFRNWIKGGGGGVMTYVLEMYL